MDLIRSMHYESEEDGAQLVQKLLAVDGFKDRCDLRRSGSGDTDHDDDEREPEPWGSSYPTMDCRHEHAPFFKGARITGPFKHPIDGDIIDPAPGWVSHYDMDSKSFVVKGFGSYALIPREKMNVDCHRVDGKSWREVKQEYWEVIQNAEYRELCDVASGNFKRLVEEHDADGALRDAAMEACYTMWASDEEDIPDDVDEMPWVFTKAEYSMEAFRDSEHDGSLIREAIVSDLTIMLTLDAALARRLREKIAIVHLFLLRLAEHKKRLGVEGRRTAHDAPRFCGGKRKRRDSDDNGDLTPSTSATSVSQWQEQDGHALARKTVDVDVVDIASLLGGERKVVETKTVNLEDCILGFDPEWLKLPGIDGEEAGENENDIPKLSVNSNASPTVMAEGKRKRKLRKGKTSSTVGATKSDDETKPKKCGMCAVM